MAGSQKLSTSVPSCADPILAARLEAIKQLAGGLSNRVAVLNRDFNEVRSRPGSVVSLGRSSLTLSWLSPPVCRGHACADLRAWSIWSIWSSGSSR